MNWGTFSSLPSQQNRSLAPHLVIIISLTRLFLRLTGKSPFLLSVCPSRVRFWDQFSNWSHKCIRDSEAPLFRPFSRSITYLMMQDEGIMSPVQFCNCRDSCHPRLGDHTIKEWMRRSFSHSFCRVQENRIAVSHPPHDSPFAFSSSSSIKHSSASGGERQAVTRRITFSPLHLNFDHILIEADYMQRSCHGTCWSHVVVFHVTFCAREGEAHQKECVTAYRLREWHSTETGVSMHSGRLSDRRDRHPT